MHRRKIKEVDDDMQALLDDEEDEEGDELNYNESLKNIVNDRTVPVKAISFAIILFIMGFFFLGLGIMILTGYYETDGEDERGWPLIIIGLITFLPGSWATTIAICSYFKIEGWSYSELPKFA